jgi:hypothetical protein
MRCCEVLVSLAALVAVGDEPAKADVVRFVRGGAEVSLSRQEQSKIADEVRLLMVGCGINSIDNPQIFGGSDVKADWDKVRKGSHLYVRWAEPAVSQHGAGSMSEAVVGFDQPTFMGPELTRHQGLVVAHVKCSGHWALELMCGTALRAHLLPGQSRACEAYDRIGPPAR